MLPMWAYAWAHTAFKGFVASNQKYNCCKIYFSFWIEMLPTQNDVGIKVAFEPSLFHHFQRNTYYRPLNSVRVIRARFKGTLKDGSHPAPRRRVWPRIWIPLRVLKRILNSANAFCVVRVQEGIGFTQKFNVIQCGAVLVIRAKLLSPWCICN